MTESLKTLKVIKLL